MSEKVLRNIFVFGTLFFFAILAVLTVVSLQQVSAGRTPPLTDQVVSGKDTFRRKNCNDCHTILGIGGYFAPELTKVAERRDPPWLRQWLTDPQSVEAGVSMPNQHLDPAQIENVIAFFQWVAQIDTNNWPPQPLVTAVVTGTMPMGTQNP